MRTLFTVDTTQFTSPTERYEALEALANGLHEEFPAYYVAETVTTDFVAALVVSGVELRPAHLNGWGRGDLTLRLVA